MMYDVPFLTGFSSSLTAEFGLYKYSKLISRSGWPKVASEISNRRTIRYLFIGIRYASTAIEPQYQQKSLIFESLCPIKAYTIFVGMSRIYTTEITSEQIASDNPIHQRLFKAYVASEPYLKGDILEVGCGEGRGVELLIRKAETFTAVDKIKPVIDRLKEAYPKGTFLSMNIPPLSGLESNRYDVIVTFQVIEHIENDR